MSGVGFSVIIEWKIDIYTWLTGKGGRVQPVSYTHLDVYKRQFLSNGKITEEGTHDELMQKGGAYSQMFALQSQYYQNKEVAAAYAEA